MQCTNLRKLSPRKIQETQKTENTQNSQPNMKDNICLYRIINFSSMTRVILHRCIANICRLHAIRQRLAGKEAGKADTRTHADKETSRHGLSNYVDTKAKCRRVKKLTHRPKLEFLKSLWGLGTEEE